MSVSPVKDTPFFQNIKHLGFQEDDSLILVDQDKIDVKVFFHVEMAKEFKATAVYLRKQLNGGFKPQVYLFDFTNKTIDAHAEQEISDIQKKIWTSGEVPLACIVFKTVIKIIDCTTHITNDFKPEYLYEYMTDTLQASEKAHKVYNDQFSVQIKNGTFWENEEFRNRFNFQKQSAYEAFISNIHKVKELLYNEFKKEKDIEKFIAKILIQSILIKYLEERVDGSGGKLLTDNYFKKYDGASSFTEVLKRKSCFSKLLEDLDGHFNGNVFKWGKEELEQLGTLDLSKVAELLETKKVELFSPQLEFDWRYFEFKYIPVELISRLYETFLGENKAEKGMYYTPSHLVKLLVDESIPLSQYETIDPEQFSICDPACGSGIFLVVAFKRLVQIWRARNNFRKPSIKTLKTLLKSLHGIDKEYQAIQLTSFSLSLALCNELDPIRIIHELQFDDLREENLVCSDYFTCCGGIKDKKFNLVIGNPPFRRAAISEYSTTWNIGGRKIAIPQGQIALKFLAESFYNLKDNGLVCLIIKSSGLLYNSTSNSYKKALFENYDIVQIFDFTALARNRSLWDNGADVAATAIFIKNKRPDYTTNILHITFKRTKIIKDRIAFEIDDNDMYFINRQAAINDGLAWKANLLGGGRIKDIITRLKTFQKMKDFLKENNCIIEEGFEIGSKKDKSPDSIYNIPFLPTEAISEQGINYDMLRTMSRETQFTKVPNEAAFSAPNLIIWEDIGESRFPMFFNEISFSFKRRLISIKSLDNDISLLNCILKSFEQHYLFYKFYFLVTSSETLVNRNTTFLLKDIKNIPFIRHNDNPFTDVDINIINDCIRYSQDFFIHGEKSRALNSIKEKDMEFVIVNYAVQFANSLNGIYRTGKRRFRLSDVVVLTSGLIAVVFRYDSKSEDHKIHKDILPLDISSLLYNSISSNLTAKRTIRLYPQKDMVIFIKPNQYRYWLALTAYRDADKCIADFADAGL